VQWILGVRTTFNGLEIAPVIPKSWPGFTATRSFRGVVYKISVARKGDGNQIALTVDARRSRVISCLRRRTDGR